MTDQMSAPGAWTPLVQAIVLGLVRLAMVAGGVVLALRPATQPIGAALVMAAIGGDVGDKLVVARKVEAALMTPPPQGPK